MAGTAIVSVGISIFYFYYYYYYFKKIHIYNKQYTKVKIQVFKLMSKSFHKKITIKLTSSYSNYFQLITNYQKIVKIIFVSSR